MKKSLVVTALFPLSLVAFSACSLHRRTPASPQTLQTLWSEPTDISKRDLFYGAGGKEREPKAGGKFKVVGRKMSGTQPGYEVEDVETGDKWSVKLGVEARTEVTASRLVWAVGYYQPFVYYVPNWTMVMNGKDSVMGPARFRLGAPTHHKVGEWSWRSNPFVGSRELSGLFTMMVMMNNWDIKREQNTLYDVVVTKGDTSKQWVVRDLGASFGHSKWLSFGSKDKPDEFDKEPFIVGKEHNRVKFGYQGSWLAPQLLGSVSPDDAAWISGLLARLSDTQWHDAFRAGGFSDTEADRYIRRLQQKVKEGLAVVSN